MSEVFTGWALLLVVIWPLLVVAGVVFEGTRSLALKCVSWAALPALAMAVLFSDAGLDLPGAMLGSELVLDGTGRIFLTLTATLWLATGLLARSQLNADSGSRFAVLSLLAMSGGIGMALAGDALLFFAASAVAGYSLYGLLVHDGDVSTQRAGRVLVVLLVVSDLVVFEFLLILAQEAEGVDFSSLRQAFVNTDQHALLLGLLVVGFGIKVGVGGLHFWLAPVFATAASAVRPAVVGFMLGAGVMGWLRLMPLGELQWIAAGGVLQWLAWITLGYAVIVGLLQTHVLSILACVAVALSAFFVALLGLALLCPQAWNEVAEAAMVAVLQSGFALAAVLLLGRGAAVGDPAWVRRLFRGAKWLAAWLLAAVPLSVGEALGNIDGMAASQMQWLIAATVFLAVRGLLLAGEASDNPDDSVTVVPQSTQVSTAAILLVAGGLTAAALLAAAFSPVELSAAKFWLNTLMMVVAAALAAWLSTSRLVLHRPALPSGDLLVPIGNGLIVAFGRGRRLGERQLPVWRDAGLALVRRLWSRVDFWRIFERIESWLNRWDTTLVILLLLGLLLVWLSGG